jgi:hypothetical protein
MPDPRPETVLETAVRLARAGTSSAESALWALAASEVVVLTPAGAPPTAETLEPLVVHRDDATFLAVFTGTDRVSAEFGEGRTPVAIPASLLLRGVSSEVGLVVNPGSPDAMEVPAQGLAAFRSLVWGGGAGVRYFIRQHVQDGALVPFALLRRTTEAGRHRDEVLRDVDSWAPDRNGTIERAVRFPLETDLEEVSPAAAAEVEQMVADRRYRPLSER